jgi:hypothetical protein
MRKCVYNRLRSPQTYQKNCCLAPGPALLVLRSLPWPFLQCNRGGGSSLRSQLLNALEYSLSLLELDLEEEITFLSALASDAMK